MMQRKIQLDKSADNEVSLSGKPGIAYFNIDAIGQVEIEFIADYNENGERNEYWGGQLAVEGNTWIEVDKVHSLNVKRIATDDDENLPLDTFIMTCDDEMIIKQHIEDLVCGIETETKPANSYYSD